MFTRMICSAAIAVMMLSSPTWAKDNDKGHGKGNKHVSKSHGDHHKGGGNNREYHDYDHNRDGDGLTINLNFNQQQAVYDRLHPYYVHKCPPGLKKKHNGCLPPGHAKQYIVGQPLPAGVTYWPLPQDVLMTMPPAPYGAQYVWVDRDVLLISEATKKVLDAVVLLSAVR